MGANNTWGRSSLWPKLDESAEWAFAAGGTYLLKVGELPTGQKRYLRKRPEARCRSLTTF